MGNTQQPNKVSNEIDRDSVEIVSKDDIKSYFKCDLPIILSGQVWKIKDDIIDMRRWFHKNPELSYKEFNTSKTIIEYLKELKNIKIKSNIAKTGVIGILKGNKPGPCILLRADMDALPINETLSEYNKAFISQNKGVMHACGHDCHISILLGAATILSKLQYLLHGSVKFCFQPAEEGGAGAKAMIDEGILSNDIIVDQVYGLHVWSYDAFGTARIHDGPFMAGAMMFSIKIKGKGGHAAIPHGTNDCTVACAYLIQQLNTIVSRNINPKKTCVLTIGTVKCGYKSNIISDYADLTGTLRWFEKEIMELALKRMREIFQGIEQSFGVEITFEISKLGGITETIPPTTNIDKNCINIVRKCVKEVLPSCDVSGKGKYGPTMAGEDFSFFLNEKPGCFFFLGCAVEENTSNTNDDIKTNDTNNATSNTNIIYPHHKPNFKVDERVLIVGVQIMVGIVLENLLPGEEFQQQT